LAQILGLKLSVGISASNPLHLVFRTADSVTNFLPQLTKAGVLSSIVVNPSSSPAGRLAGDLLALQLNAFFDARRGASAKLNLTSLVLVNGACAGLTVGAVLDIADEVLSGLIPPVFANKVSLYVPATIDACVAAINSNFLDGLSVGAFLAVPGFHLQANANIKLPAISTSVAVNATVFSPLSVNAALGVRLAGISANVGLSIGDGFFGAWQLDPTPLTVGAELTVKAFTLSSASASVTGAVVLDTLVDVELMALVNYVLNFHGASIHAAVDVQLAILQLLQQNTSLQVLVDALGLTDYHADVVAAIVADAKLNGQGFVPAPGQLVGIVVKVNLQRSLNARLLISITVPALDLSVSSKLCVAV